MSRLLFLFLIIFSLTTYGQDTLAVIEPKNGADDVEVFFDGDTAFVRMFYDPAKTAARGSSGSWYRDKTRLADVDLNELRSDRLLGIHSRGSTTYFYTYRDAGKKTAISGYRSDSFGPAAHLFTTTLPGCRRRGLRETVTSRSFYGKGRPAPSTSSNIMEPNSQSAQI